MTYKNEQIANQIAKVIKESQKPEDIYFYNGVIYYRGQSFKIPTVNSQKRKTNITYR
jgi:hypothetical protein